MAFNLIVNRPSRFASNKKASTYLNSLYPSIDSAITANNFAGPRPNVSSECCCRTPPVVQDALTINGVDLLVINAGGDQLII